MKPKSPPLLNLPHRVLCTSFLGLAVMALPNLLQADEEALIATQDAYIRPGNSADSNFNTLQLDLAGRMADVNRKIYLQFELPGNAATTTGATLRLTIKDTIAADGDPVEAGVPFKVFAAVSDNPELWSETAITWNNAPGNSAGPMAASDPWVEVGSRHVPLRLDSREQVVEVALNELPALLKTEKGGNLTLILAPAIQNLKAPGLSFFSAQVAGKPHLWPTLILTR